MNKKFFRSILLIIAGVLTLFGVWGFLYTLIYGLKGWGLTNRTIWGVEIVNFVFWIGNSHAGTLISAILYLLRQDWRNSIHRIAETITIISIMIAATFPFIHLGRPWFFYWLLPLPNQTTVWPIFKSPLVWDVAAVLSYAILSFLFWFIGILPDYRYIKINTTSKLGKSVRSFFSIFWTGSNFNWDEFKWTYHLLAGILTFVVISVHSIVSFDFSVTILPLWHSTMLPIFFVIGAIYSGLALVLLCSSVLNLVSSLGKKITSEARTNLAKLLITFSFILMYFYLIEFFFSYYNLNPQEKFIFNLRFQKEYLWMFVFMIFATFLFPQLLWFTKFRNNNSLQILVSTSILIGMWFERYLLIVPVLSADLITKETFFYSPTIIDLSLTFGSIGFFTLCFYFIGKLIPLVPKFET